MKLAAEMTAKELSEALTNGDPEGYRQAPTRLQRGVVTNRYDLPAPYVRAVSDQRIPAPRSISVTQLIQPPQMLGLWHAHAHELVQDASEMVDLFFGNAIHHYLDHYAGTAQSEQRIVFEHDGWTIHGTPDHAEWLGIEGGILTDWKTTKVRALGYDKPEWEQQVNLYAHLLRLNGQSVQALQVWAFLKDWDRSLLRDQEYPRAPLCRIDIPLWDAAEAHEFMLDRLALHVAALDDGVFAPCTSEEKWQRSTWAVWSKKGDAQKPSRVVQSPSEARAWAESKTERPRAVEDWWDIVERRGQPLRCQSYCAVSAWCEQRAAETQADTEIEAALGASLSQVSGTRLRVVDV